MTEEVIEINGQKYRVGKLDVFKQFHIVRRVAPLLAGLGSAFQKKAAGEGDWALSFMGPFAEALAGMSDEAVDYVLQNCLAVCFRLDKVSTQYQAVIVKGTKQVMFEDIDMSVMLELTFKVIGENLANFFAMAQFSSPVEE